jgi:hypothetical protein
VSGVQLSVLPDTTKPEEILKTNNVIVLGNMGTNDFIKTLYRQWYTFLDTKYPGKGGYVVRTLHNPYGTGHNVLLLGGSDDKGVQQAIDVFNSLLKPGNPMKIGRLMEIKLGTGIIPPELDEESPGLGALSWADSFRKLPGGGATGYEPATFFGWNPISIAGVLYYMTGQKKYLDAFKSMAMPDPRNIPLPNKTSDAFNDPLDPLVKNDHYRSHFVDCVWDLIEESPLFTDQERLFITNKLMQHQHECDPDNTYSKSNGDRHAMWHMLSIYTGSRYFAKYYPEQRWTQRLENVRRAFRSLINNPTWGVRDTLSWVATSTEPVFEFFMFDGFEEFVESGTAVTMMRALEVLMTGAIKDDYNQAVPISLLHKAAFMTGESKYIWMVRKLNFDFDRFRIGQSYWPMEGLAINPPTDLVGRVSVFPLAKTYWEQIGKVIPEDQGFQILSYRSGLTDKDDYLFLDGFSGMGRNPYHLNTISHLRMFGGKAILDGYGNDVDVLYDGSVNGLVPRAAVLVDSFAANDSVYMHSLVPDMNSAVWHRRVFYRKDNSCIVLDDLTPAMSGEFDMTCTWGLGGVVEKTAKGNRQIDIGNGIHLASADHDLDFVDAHTVRESVSGRIAQGGAVFFANIFSSVSSPRNIEKIDTGVYHVSGSSPAITGVGDFVLDNMTVRADFIYLDKAVLFLAGGKEFTLNGKRIFSSDRPVALSVDLVSNELIVDADKGALIDLGCVGKACHFDLAVGQHKLPDVQLDIVVKTAIEHAVINENSSSSIKETIIPMGLSSMTLEERKKDWSVQLEAKITHIVPSLHFPVSGLLWVATEGRDSSELVGVSSDGQVKIRIPCDSSLLALWPAKSSSQAGYFAVLAGFKDDTVRAFSESGKEVWRFKAELYPDFRIGGRYDAPWFTDPNPPYNKRGIQSIIVGYFWGHGTEEMAIGRACTVEFRNLAGELLARVPTRWGNNSELAAARMNVKGTDNPIVLAGKDYTGNPQLSGISSDYMNISDSLYSDLPTGYIDMHAWLQRGMNHLIVDDLHGDGIAEVIYTLSGHWNELRVYNGLTAKPLWLRYYGPGQSQDDFMRALQVSDLNKDGVKEICTGTKKGRVNAFSCGGDGLWSKQLPAPIKKMCAPKSGCGLFVGLEDGGGHMLDSQGKQSYIAQEETSIDAVFCLDDTVFIGTATGKFSAWSVPVVSGDEASLGTAPLLKLNIIER